MSAGKGSGFGVQGVGGRGPDTGCGIWDAGCWVLAVLCGIVLLAGDGWAGTNTCRRLITYSPALTQIAFDMGVGDLVIGVNRWSNLPPGETRPVVGDPITVEIEEVIALDPDAVLVQLADVKAFEPARRRRPDLRVEHFDIETLADIRVAVERIGLLTGRTNDMVRVLQRWDAAWAAARAAGGAAGGPRVLFVLNTDRPMVAGEDTFVDEMIRAVGATNAGRDIRGPTRWRNTDIEHIVLSRPDVIVCQVFPPGGEASAEAYWRQWAGHIPAAASGRVHVVSSPEWTIPSLRLAGLVPELFRMAHGRAMPE